MPCAFVPEVFISQFVRKDAFPRIDMPIALAPDVFITSEDALNPKAPPESFIAELEAPLVLMLALITKIFVVALGK